MTDDRTMRERMLAWRPHRLDGLRELFTELLGHFGDGARIRPPFQCDADSGKTTGLDQS